MLLSLCARNREHPPAGTKWQLKRGLRPAASTLGHLTTFGSRRKKLHRPQDALRPLVSCFFSGRIRPAHGLGICNDGEMGDQLLAQPWFKAMQNVGYAGIAALSVSASMWNLAGRPFVPAEFSCGCEIAHSTARAQPPAWTPLYPDSRHRRR